MIRIEKLRMHLPPGFEHRAASIARLLANALAARHLPADRVAESISLPRQHIALNATDAEIARQIADCIADAAKESAQ